MSIDGLWKLTIKTPMGKMETDLDLKTEDGKLSGVQTGQGQSLAIIDPKFEGDQLTWANAITTPMKMTLVFTATVTGDEMKGKCKAGVMGSPGFTGVRVAASA